MNSIEIARYLIEHTDHMTVATADISGKPWVSPVFFSFDSQYNFYWVSSRKSLHSQNIRIRPEIAIVISGPVPPNNGLDGVYIDARAIELESESEIRNGIQALAKRPQPTKFTTRSSEDVTDEAVWRMYKATPVAISKRADTVENGQAITIRESLELQELRR